MPRLQRRAALYGRAGQGWRSFCAHEDEPHPPWVPWRDEIVLNYPQKVGPNFIEIIASRRVCSPLSRPVEAPGPR